MSTDREERPVVLPETYTVEGSFEEWNDHFESAALENRWNDASKKLWLRVRLVGRAQTVLRRLDETTRNSYEDTMTALKEQFEPASKRLQYEAEFPVRTDEDWSSFGEDLTALAEKELEENAGQRLAVGHYLNQTQCPIVAFAVKQTKPKKISEAISATLEMESYRGTLGTSSTVPQPVAEGETMGAVHSTLDTMMEAIQQLTARMEQLETRK